MINAAAPVGIIGATLLTTRNATDITDSVRAARSTLGTAVGLALLISIFLSLYMARTIVQPLRSLAKSAIRVRLGRERQVVVPRLPERRDEIGLLARAVSDMTDRLRQRIDAVDSFAADVAHEIKNPLASLRSAMESLGKVEDPELRRQLTDIATHDVRRIDRLVSEISDASRIDAELSRAVFEPVNLGQLIANILGTRQDRAENAGHPIEFERPGWSSIILGVPTRLERVIENLLDNAVSFSPKDAPVTVELEREQGWIAVTICDEGPGIAEEERDKVFRRFHSVRPDDEDFGQHSGLGLAIARTIIEAHDGTLTALPRADGKSGACMRFELPAAPINP